jgi:SPP1 family predicted phage head-tail adaptor
MKLKDKKIEILAVQNVINENGYAETTLVPACPLVWAYYRHLSGNEYFAANAEHVKEEVLFRINWRNDVTTAHVIRYNGVLWNIARVDTFEGYKGDITLYCKRH